MRFFKAFNILHRRTKSATFVSGPPLDPLTSPNAIDRYSSLSHTHLSFNRANGAPSSHIFDMATSEFTSPPPQFTHNAGRPSSFWRSKRQSLIEEEHARMREAINFWISEHSKLHAAFTTCHAELVAMRKRNLELQRKSDLDSQMVVDLRSKLTHFSQPTQVISHRPVIVELAKASVPSMPQTARPSKKAPTVDEYSNALRITLATRKELRDQKKVAKFWKRRASLTAREPRDLITPSASEISSIREALPLERKTALDALITERGLASRLANISLLGQFPFTDRPQQFNVVLPEVSPSVLTTSDSINSFKSRLPPLASESLKEEISSMFGSSRRQSTLPRRARHVIASASLTISPSRKSVISGHTQDSSRSLNERLEKNLGVVDHDLVASLSGSFLEGLPSMSSSDLQNSALPSGSSEVFGEQTGDAARYPNHASIDRQGNEIAYQHPSIKQASKTCTSRRSWQHYTLANSSAPNRSDGAMQSAPVRASRPQSSDDKENKTPGISIPFFRRRRSLLPVPFRRD